MVEVTESATEALLKKGVASKAKAKSKTAQVASTASGSTDVLLKTAYDVENLEKDKAFELAQHLIYNKGLDDFKLGGVLAVIQSHGWLEGYEKFADLIRGRFGLEYRKALNLIENYHALVTKQIPWEKVKDIGWTKLNIIHKVITPENVDEWVAKIVQGKMTADQLKDILKSEKGGVPKSKSNISSKVFKLHPDQRETIDAALEKAKAEFNTEFDSVALETICVGYLGGSVSGASLVGANLKDVMAGHTMEDILSVFEKQFPDVNLTVAVPTE